MNLNKFDEFIKTFALIGQKKREILLLKASEVQLFSSFEEDSNKILQIKLDKSITDKKYVFGNPMITLNSEPEETYDYILGDLPLGMNKSEINVLGMKVRSRYNWIMMLRSLFTLNKEGKAVFVVEPVFFDSDDGRAFQEILDTAGYYIETIVQIKKEVFNFGTSIEPCLIIISREKVEKCFIFELDLESDIKSISENFSNNKSVSIRKGLFVALSKFDGFEKYKIYSELELLVKNYKEFKSKKVKDVAKSILVGKPDKCFTEENNCIYLSRRGEPNCYTNLRKISRRQENYIQLKLKPIILNEYLNIFFQSRIGSLMLKTLIKGNVVGYIDLSRLNDLDLPIPEIALQKKIVQSHEKIAALKNKIIFFEKEMAINPHTVSEIEPLVLGLLDSLDELNDSEKIQNIINTNENEKIEFKSTLRKALDPKIPDSVIELSVIKSLAGFLNAKGGTLLVGVSDDKKVLGLSYDGFKSNDAILLHVKNILKKNFESKFYDLISYRIVSVFGKNVLYFECKPSSEPVFVRGKDFYVRSSPATDKLEGKMLLDYIKNHFGGKK